MYVIVRTDLSYPQVAVQSCHAAFEAAKLAEYEEHPSIILCGVKSEASLRKALERIQSLNFPYWEFHENDMDDQLTSICVVVPEESKSSMRKFQLLRSSK